MKRLILLLFLTSSFIFNWSQGDPDSTNIEVEVGEDSVPVVPSANLNGSNEKVTGVAVSPAHFHLAIEPGKSQTIKVKISNSTDRVNSFKIGLVDFDQNSEGRASFKAPSDTSKYGLSKWTNVAPTFVTLQPFQKKDITVVVDIPDDESGLRAGWCILMVEQEEPKQSLEVSGSGKDVIGFGVKPTFAFGVYIYQNPPNVNNTNVEIVDFKHVKKDSINGVSIQAVNKGDGIAYCTSYIDLLNFDTGEQNRLMVKRFTVLPGVVRDFKFQLDADLPKGNYGAIGVIDFEGAPEIQAAKMKFKIE
ncbi:MAG: DUF916 domain-containing protein [Flavobacteriales bacterium]|nr:DUF916 domain-containing protein [Flavobacteriales bacterium]